MGEGALLSTYIIHNYENYSMIKVLRYKSRDTTFTNTGKRASLPSSIIRNCENYSMIKIVGYRK